MKILEVACPYCRKVVEVGSPESARAPIRGWLKVECPHCESKMHVDIAVRRGGESKNLKEEKKRAEIAQAMLVMKDGGYLFHRQKKALVEAGLARFGTAYAAIELTADGESYQRMAAEAGDT